MIYRNSTQLGTEGAGYLIYADIWIFVTNQHKLRTIAHVGTLYQPLRGRFAEQIGGDNIN